jgi:hypothetical protein
MLEEVLAERDLPLRGDGERAHATSLMPIVGQNILTCHDRGPLLLSEGGNPPPTSASARNPKGK